MIYLCVFLLSLGFTFTAQHFLIPAEHTHALVKQSGGYIFRRDVFCGAIWFLIALMPLFLTAALRKGIGTDYYFTYTPRFLEILAGERTYYEIGFYLFNRILGMFTSNPQWVFVTTSGIFFLFVGLAFYKTQKDLTFCVLILIVSGEYFISLNNLRQALASSLILFGYVYIRDKKWISFAVVCAVASTLHKSMIVFFAMLIVFYALEYISIEKFVVIMTIAVGVFFLLIKVFPSVLVAVLPERLAYYIEYSIFNEATIGTLRMLENIAIFAFLLYTREKTGEKKLDCFVAIQFFAVAICLFDSVVPAAYRLMRLFSFWQLLSIPTAAQCYNYKNDRLTVKILLALFYGVICFYSIVILGDEEVIPYRSIFNG